MSTEQHPGNGRHGDDTPGIPGAPGETSTPYNTETLPSGPPPAYTNIEHPSQNNYIDMDDDDIPITEDHVPGRFSKQPSEVAHSVSLSGILRDVEIDSIDHSRHVPYSTAEFTRNYTGYEDSRDNVTVDIYTSRMSRLAGEIDAVHNVKLPSITPRGRRSLNTISKSKFPKYHTYYGGKRYYMYNTRVRLSKVYNKQQKVMMKSEANFIRMCKIVVVLGTTVMKEVLKSYTEKLYPPKDFQQFLEHFKRRLISYASTEKIVSDRWKILYPEDNSPVQLRQLDPAIIFWFLRHICHFKKQTDLVWKWKAPDDDFSVMADVIRIRDLRNGLINAVDEALFEDEYERKINELNDIIYRVLADRRRVIELQELLKTMKVNSVKQEEKHEYLFVLNRWANDKKDRNIEKITPSKQDWNTVKTCKGTTRRFLRRFRKPKVFVKTSSYKLARDILIQKGYVVLVGNTGEGKTSAALAIMASLFEQDDMLVLTSPDQWRFVNKHTVGAVLIEDFLGSMHFDEKQLTQWKPYLQQMHRCCCTRDDKQALLTRCDGCNKKSDRSGAKVIITMRKHVYEQQKTMLSEYNLFNHECIVDFSSKDLSYQEKRTMLSRHVIAGHKVKTEVDKSSRLHTSSLGFPQTCALFASRDEFMDMGSVFYESPIEILRYHLDDLHQTDPYGYLILVVMMFQPGGVISYKKLKEFKDETFRAQFFDLALVCGIAANKQLPKHCLSSLSNKLQPYIYYYDDIGSYTFIHESVMEIMMSVFVERYPQHVLETCALQFLMDYVATDVRMDESRDQLFTMRLQKQNFWLLAELFVQNITQGHVVKIAQHRAFRDPNFIHFFFDFIQKKGYKEDLILRIDTSAKDEGSKTTRRVGFLHGAVDQNKPNVELALAILRLGYHVQKVVSPEWCTSELKSSLGVAVRRGSYEIYAAIVATDIDIPEKLLQEKQYMTSLKIITDLLVRRMWTKEQIDVALVRAARRGTLQSTDIVLHLLHKGASLSSTRAGTTALCEAVKSGSTKTVTVLLNAGADVNDRDTSDQTPLHHACDWNKLEIAKQLVSTGADVNVRDSSGLSPFLVAAGWDHTELLDYLLTRKIRPFSTDDQDNNVLHICAANGRTNAMRKVIDSLPDEMASCLTARNKYGWTPLDFAIKYGHLGAVKFLIRTILRQDTKKVYGTKHFNPMRFNTVRKEDFDRNERFLRRFVDLEHGESEYFQVPKCKWFVQAGSKQELDKISVFVARYDDRLKKRLAKS